MSWKGCIKVPITSIGVLVIGEDKRGTRALCGLDLGAELTSKLTCKLRLQAEEAAWS